MRRLVEVETISVAAALVVLLGVGELLKLAVPVGLELVGHKAIARTRRVPPMCAQAAKP